MKFFFVFGFWSGHPIEVDRDPFPFYTRELRNLRLEDMFFFIILFLSFAYNRITLLSPFFFFFFFKLLDDHL